MEKTLIAKILKPKGLKGEVKLSYFGQDMSDLKEGQTLYLDGNKQLILRKKSKSGDFLYAFFEGVDTIEKAEELKSQNLYLSVDDLTDLTRDEYFVKDLIGCTVLSSAGKLIGTVDEIENFGAADVFTVKNGKSEVLFSFIEGLFEQVDLKNKKIVINEQLFEEVKV